MVPSHLFTVFIGSTSLGTCNHKPSWVCFERERGKLEVKAHMAKGSVELKIQGFFFFLIYSMENNAGITFTSQN